MPYSSGTSTTTGSNKRCLCFVVSCAIVTWGHPGRGGDSSSVQDQLKGVVQIQATHYAFAAILEDGSVVSWGDNASGGTSAHVQKELKGVQQIQGTHAAFAAILEDRSVVT